MVGNVCFNVGFIFGFLTLLMYSFVVLYGNFKTDLLLSLLLWIFLCLSNAIFLFGSFVIKLFELFFLNWCLQIVFDAGHDPSQLGNLYASGRIPKLEPTETPRSQWMAPNARTSALVHRKLYLFYFTKFGTILFCI